MLTVALAPFDFRGFARAIEARDSRRWLAFYAEDAVWLELKPSAPPRSPDRREGRAEIGAFLDGVAAAPLELSVSHEVVGRDRIAFRLTVLRPDGRRIVEHVILELRDGLITQQTDVEAWD